MTGASLDLGDEGSATATQADSAETFAVAVAQTPSVIGDLAANLEVTLETMRQASDLGVRLVVFPECGLTGYVFDSLEDCAMAALNGDDPALRAIADLAELLGQVVVVGYLENAEEPGAVHNTATLFGPGGLRADYRKVHLPYMCADRFVTPGTQQPVVVDTPVGAIGLSICYDLRFPEWARSLTLAGAQIIANPTNWALSAERVPRLLAPARALENAVFLLIADRGDAERGVDFLGNSVILAPNGDALATCGRGNHLVVSDITPSTARRELIVFEKGTSEISIYADRRPVLYSSIAHTPVPAQPAAQ